MRYTAKEIINIIKYLTGEDFTEEEIEEAGFVGSTYFNNLKRIEEDENS